MPFDMTIKGIYEDLVQPSPLVLFSSLPVSAPFAQASLSIDSQLAPDSFIALIDDRTHQVVKASPKPLIYYHPSYKPSSSELVKPANLLGIQDPTWPIRSTVLHIQSPNCKNTFIRLPGWDKNQEPSAILGIKLPFLHLQIKPLDHTFMVEVGVRDQAGDQILIRCSTFQTGARFYVKSQPSNSARATPNLIHLPLIFPSSEAYAETKWSDLLLPLAHLIPTRYHSTDFIKVHASIRMRRIYFTADGKQASLNSNTIHHNYDAECKQVITNENNTTISVNSIFQPELTLFRGAKEPQTND